MPDPGFYNIPEAYPRKLSLTFEHVIQQEESKFMGMQDTQARWTGKEYVFRDLSKNAWTRNDTRGGDTVGRESQFSFRKVYKKKVEGEAIWFPEWDKELLDDIALPTSEEMQAQKAGFNRIYDDLCIEAAFEDALGGADPYNTAIVFPSSQSVAVNYGTPVAPTAGSNQPLTPWKLVRARKMFSEADIDVSREELCLAISPEEIEDMIYYSSTYSTEMWAKVVGEWVTQWQSGNKLAKLMGYNVVETNRLSETSGIRNCIAYCRSAFVKSATTDVKMSLDRVPQKKNALLLQGSAMVGIGRRHDEKVIKLPCYHA